jgi:hypothetical protein
MINNQLEPKPLKRSLYSLPVLLLLYAIYNSSRAGINRRNPCHGDYLPARCRAIGLIQGKITKVYQRNDNWFRAGSWIALAVFGFFYPHSIDD